MSDINGAHVVDLGALKSPEELENIAEQLHHAAAVVLDQSPEALDLGVTIYMAQTAAIIAISKRLGKLADIVKNHR